MGLFRNVAQAYVWGTGTESQAFTCAWNIPSSIFDLILGAAVLGVFIPIYNECFVKDETASKRFTNMFFNVILLLTAFVCALGVIFAPQLISLQAPGFDAATHAQAVQMLRIMFPSVILIGATYVLVGLLQSGGSYLIPAFVSIISNVFLVAYLLADHGRLGIIGLAVAVVISWAIQFATLFIPAVRKGYRWKPEFSLRDPLIVTAGKRALPIISGSWMVPILSFVGITFAMHTASGNSTAFGNAFQLFLMVGGILTYGVCNYIFPQLSKLSGLGDEQKFRELVTGGLSAALYIIALFFCIMFAAGGQIVAILYRHGAFTAESSAMVSRLFRMYAPGMFGFVFAEVLNRVFYADRKPWVAALASLIGVVVNVAASVIAVFGFHADMYAVALCGALAQLAAALALLIAVHRRMGDSMRSGFYPQFVKIIISGAVTLAAMLGISRLWGSAPESAPITTNLLHLLVIAAVGIIVYLACSFILKIAPFQEFLKVFRKPKNIGSSDKPVGQ